MYNDDQVRELAERIRSSSAITVLTGAGVSAASGVPTFRGSGGLWKNYPAHQLATPEAFALNPQLVWEWYNWRREVVAGCRPNPAHEVIAAWEKRFPQLQLITQNVDGLHERAGSRRILRFHGSIWDVRCRDRCPSSPPRWRDETVPFRELPPKCPYCGGIIRPDVVWFGEIIDPEVFSRSYEAASCELFVSVGTSAVVYPAAGITHAARSSGAFTVEVNLEVTPASDLVDLLLQGPAEEILQEVEARLVTGKAG